PIIKAVTDLVQNGQGVSASVTLETLGEDPQRLTLNLARDGATRHLTVELRGDWSQTAEAPRGTPLTAGFNGKFYQRRSPNEEPIAKPGDWIRPDGEIGIGMQGKSQRWLVRLSPNFSRGAQLVSYGVDDGQDVEPGTVLCYIDEVKGAK
ncbi:MAG: hypothetical protein AAB649_03800, partial [Patescibacteria group bacterium]